MPLDSPVKIKSKRQPLFHREDRERMIACADEDIKAAVLIASYATIRTCELDRACFEDINRSNSTLPVYADAAKTGVARFIQLVPELIKGLRPYLERTGRISPYKNLSRFWPRLANRAGAQWRKNDWRKAVLSHLVAFTQNFDGVAAQAGTSVKELKGTYVSGVPFEVGGAWFGLGGLRFPSVAPSLCSDERIDPTTSSMRRA
jgi:hypothetical protein